MRFSAEWEQIVHISTVQFTPSKEENTVVIISKLSTGLSFQGSVTISKIHLLYIILNHGLKNIRYCSGLLVMSFACIA